MGWEEEHKKQVARMPEAIRAAHRHSSNHREELLASSLCGCFHCCSRFAPNEISDWVDEVNGVGQTALCPRCGIDSVLGDHAGVELSAVFLGEMNRYWF